MRLRFPYWRKLAGKPSRTLDIPIADDVDIALGGPFIGIGWGPPLYTPESRISARSISIAHGASVFVRVAVGVDHLLRFKIHPQPNKLATQLQIVVCGLPIETVLSGSENDRLALIGIIPSELTHRFAGRLCIKIGCVSDNAEPLAETIFLSHLEIVEANEAGRLEYSFALEHKSFGPQRLRIAELEKQVTGLQTQVSELQTRLQVMYELAFLADHRAAACCQEARASLGPNWHFQEVHQLPLFGRYRGRSEHRSGRHDTLAAHAVRNDEPAPSRRKLFQQIAHEATEEIELVTRHRQWFGTGGCCLAASAIVAALARWPSSAASDALRRSGTGATPPAPRRTNLKTRSATTARAHSSTSGHSV